MQKFKSGDKGYFQSAPVEVIAAKKDFKTNKCSYIIQTSNGPKTVNENELLSYDEFVEVIKAGENELDAELTKLTNSAKLDLPIDFETDDLPGEDEEDEEDQEDEEDEEDLPETDDMVNRSVTDADLTMQPQPIRRRGNK